MSDRASSLCALQGEINRSANEFRGSDTRQRSEFRIHGYGREPRDRVDLVHDELAGAAVTGLRAFRLERRKAKDNREAAAVRVHLTLPVGVRWLRI
jgi:hypothetical protein